MIKTAESHENPKRLIRSHGKVYYNFNVQQIDRDGQTVYQYSYVEIEPPATRKKVLQALKADNAEIDEADAADIDTEHSIISERLAEIAEMDWTQIDAHIDNTFGNLNTAQTNSLKMLYKAVLALIKVM